MTASPPPSDDEAELAVLGGILLSGQVLKVVLIDEGLKTEHFWRDKHQAVFSAMLGLSEQGDPIDKLTLGAQLDRAGKLTEVGGPNWLDVLASVVPNVGSVRAYARRIVELAGWRRRLSAAYELIMACDARDLKQVATAEAMLAPEQRETTAPLADEIYSYLADRTTGRPFPFGRLNDLSNGGMYPAETTLLSAWTSVGKTILLDQTLQHVVDRGGTARVYINEGSRVQRALRMIARDKGIPYRDLRSRQLTPAQHQAVVAALRDGLPVEIVQAAGWTAADIARDMRWNPRDVIGVDILHEIPYVDERGLAANWSTLKAAGVATGCHLIATAHLNEARSIAAEPPAPTLRDIRGSGMLKNGSDNVVLLHREHEMDAGRAQMLTTGIVWFAKSRSGELGGVRVDLNTSRMRFVEMAEERFAT